jgi:hypothetical protein
MDKFPSIKITGEPTAPIDRTSHYMVSAPVKDEMTVVLSDGRCFRLTRPPVRDADGHVWVDLDSAELVSEGTR